MLAALLVLAGAFLNGGPAAGLAPRGRLSKNPADYIPARIGGKAAVLDPLSANAPASGACSIPAGGATWTPFVAGANDITQGLYAGGWECQAGQQLGTNFTVGLVAAQVVPTIPTLSTGSISAPNEHLVPGSLRSSTFKIGSQRVKVFLYRVETPITAGGPAVQIDVAAAEPRPHLLITATTTNGTKPLGDLKQMLRAGFGSSRRLL